MHGRDVEVHTEVPVDPAGHSARRDTGSFTISTILAGASTFFGGGKVSPQDTAATQPLSTSFNEKTRIRMGSLCDVLSKLEALEH